MNYPYGAYNPYAAYSSMYFSPLLIIFYIALYLYLAYCLMRIAKKTNTPNGWFAWVPILNIILMIQIAKKPIWWIVLLLIPIVNIVISIILWMKMAERLNKPSWWGVLMIVPVVNFVIPGIMAFGK